MSESHPQKTITEYHPPVLQRRGERRATINEELWGGSTFDSDSLVNQSTPRGTYTRAMHKLT